MAGIIDHETVVDREKIRDCFARYCHAIDRRDADLLRGVYWPEARNDYGHFIGTAEQFVTFAMEMLDMMVHTQHSLGHSLIEVDGARAVSETHVTAYHRFEAEGGFKEMILSSRYLDRLEKRGTDWRIIERTCIHDWLREYDDGVDWSNGLLGLPFKTDCPVGKSRGDFSEKLFPRISA